MPNLYSKNNVCNIYINQEFIIIVLTQRPPIYFTNYFPVILEKNKNEPENIIENKWDSISLHTKYKLIIVSADLKLFIKTKNEQEKHALYEALNNWKQASILSHKKADTP